MIVIILMIIGIICIVVSCLLTGREQTGTTDNETEVQVSANHITDEYELNEEEVAILQKKVSDKISADVNDIIYTADNSLSTMTNEKMMALGDYAVTVCDEIEKNHKEVMFLYSMLNDKEKELKEQKRAQLQTKRIGAYLRKMAIDGYIIQVDTRDIKEMNKLLSAIGRNINQIAKRVNAGGPTYQADMEEIRERLDQIWQLQRRILLSQR